MFENPINKLRFWCHKVIPLVYDEALSYYEVLCKVAKKINELITDVNGLHDTVVFQVNGKEPTDGNVQLGASDFAGTFVVSINGITPDDNGDITIDAEDVDAMPVDEPVVKTINGVSPNADGSILAGTVRSVNGKSPANIPTPGSVTLNASDVGALPNSIDPVESVNGITPDAQGNVNVGTVKSVNSTLPDANGNINLPTVAGVTSVDGVGADGQGNVQINAVKSVNGETPNAQGAVTLTANDIGALPDNYTPPVVSVNGQTGVVTIPTAEEGAGYCKMPDGTLICYGNSSGYPYNVASWGQLFMADFPDISFSVAFVSPPSVTLTVNSASYSCMVMAAKPTTSKIESIQLARGAAFGSGTTTIGWQAIGRWK